MKTEPVTYFGKVLRKPWLLFLFSWARWLLSEAVSPRGQDAFSRPSFRYGLVRHGQQVLIFQLQDINPEKGI